MVPVRASKKPSVVLRAVMRWPRDGLDRSAYIIFIDILSTNRLKTMPRSPVIDPEALRGAAGQAVGVLKLLANPERLLLLCQLSQGEMCVSDLEQALDIHQPTLSQQLGVLRG